ncbi:hypothetical protein D3C77_560460 [compost metagenome]
MRPVLPYHAVRWLVHPRLSANPSIRMQLSTQAFLFRTGSPKRITITSRLTNNKVHQYALPSVKVNITLSKVNRKPISLAKNKIILNTGRKEKIATPIRAVITNG